MKAFATLAAAALALLGSAAHAQTVNNGGMENWHNYSAGFLPPVALEAPNGWQGSDSLVVTYGQLLLAGTTFQKQVIKSTDKHSGSFAARLVSRTYDTLSFPASITNGKLDVNINDFSYAYSGGQPVSQRIDTVSAWLKYNPQGGDMGLMQAVAVRQGAGAGGADSVIGAGVATISALGTYTRTSVNIEYIDATQVPDRIRIVFASGAAIGMVHDGSELFVDDVTMAAGPASIAVMDFEDAVVKLYPNPAQDVLYLNATGVSGPLYFEAFSMTGQQVATQHFTGNAAIALSSMAAGTYGYRILQDGRAVQQGNFVVGK